MADRVAVLGTGIMGTPMARNLLKAGFEVTAWDRTAEKARALEADGAQAADTPAAAVAESDFVLTMLADGDAVQSVMEQAADAVPDGAIWLQMSTVGVEATGRLAKLAEQHGIAFVDAPVLGTKQPAEQGQLTVLASGPQPALERARPVFEAVGSKIVELGEAGNGSRMKLVLNSWVVALVEGLAETIAFAESIGVDPAKFLETISGGPMGPPYAELKGKMMIERDFATSFPLKHALKDARLVLEAAESAGIELPLIEAVARQMERAANASHADEDLAATIYATAAPE
jgi:3-hydroxyisobutyrate dehydrogenase